MKPRRAFSLLTGVALIGAITKFIEMPRDGRASLLANAAETARTTGRSLLSTAIAAQVEPPYGNPLWTLPLKRLSATRERPLFSPSRRPPPSPAPIPVAPVAARPPVKPAQSERPAVALVGTIIGGGDNRMGIFVDSSTQGTLRLRVGEDYHGWVVRLINSREAILVKVGEQAMVLEMPVPGTVSPKRSARDAMLDLVWKVGAD